MAHESSLPGRRWHEEKEGEEGESRGERSERTLLSRMLRNELKRERKRENSEVKWNGRIYCAPGHSVGPPIATNNARRRL